MHPTIHGEHRPTTAVASSVRINPGNFARWFYPKIYHTDFFTYHSTKLRNVICEHVPNRDEFIQSVTTLLQELAHIGIDNGEIDVEVKNGQVLIEFFHFYSKSYDESQLMKITIKRLMRLGCAVRAEEYKGNLRLVIVWLYQ